MGINNKSSSFERRFSLKRMFRSLDRLQDVIVFCCGALLVFEMMLLLVDILIDLNSGADLKQITSNSLFLLILVELFRLIAVYLFNSF